MLYGFLVFLHVVVSVILILVVLLQTGKGADLAGAFGGGGSQTAFGSRGAATLLSKVTTGAAVIFMITSFTLSFLALRGSTSVLDSVPPPATSAPASTPPSAPATTPPAAEPPATDPATQPPQSAPPQP